MNLIKDEMGVTLQTVRMSLYYVYNSPMAKSIRVRAKELLVKEAEAIID